MIKPPIDLQDLRRRIYVKAKAEPSWRFWGLYVHVCKMETLYEAYAMAKANNGAPGIDGVTFEAIEQDGLGAFLAQIRDELATRTYRPMRSRKKEIPKDGGNKVRVGHHDDRRLLPCGRQRCQQPPLSLRPSHPQLLPAPLQLMKLQSHRPRPCCSRYRGGGGPNTIGLFFSRCPDPPRRGLKWLKDQQLQGS